MCTQQEGAHTATDSEQIFFIIIDTKFLSSLLTKV